MEGWPLGFLDGGIASRGTTIGLRPYRLLVAIAVVGLVACTTGSRETGAPRAPSVDRRISGTLLVFIGFQSGLATIGLPGDDPRPLMLPEQGAFARDAFFLPDGSVLGLLQLDFDRIRAFVLSGEQPPVALGPPLRGEFTFSLSGDRLLAARCVPRPGAFVLDLTAPSAGWRETPGSCGATLSPEGDALVWSPDGRVLLEAAVEGGDDAESVLDVAELSNMPPGMDEGVSIIGTPGWGPQGIAIPLGTNERQAAAAVTPDGEEHVTALGNRGAGLGAALAWQPGGELLASGAWSNLEAAVRLSSREETRVAAIHPDPIAGLVWSPDGEVLLAASNTRWTFIASDGTWLRSVPVPRGESLPLAWRSA
jgi:hypothetical protein